MSNYAGEPENLEALALVALATPSDLVISLKGPFRGFCAYAHLPYFERAIHSFADGAGLTSYGRETALGMAKQAFTRCTSAASLASQIRARVEELDSGSWFRPIELDTGAQPFLTYAFSDRLEAEIAVLRDGIEWPDLHSGSAQRAAIEEFLGEAVSYDETAQLVAIAFTHSGEKQHEE